MWYVLDAGKDSQLISGFSRKISKEEYIKHLKKKSLPQILNYEQVSGGDVYYMPAGRVHALGPGVLLAEIQQTSDTTYRIYDWDRTDQQGNARELHIDDALDAIDFEVYEKYKTDYADPSEKSVTLVSTDHFNTNLISLEKHALEKDYSALDSFVALLCTQGRAFVTCEEEHYDIQKGELMLIPALIERILISPQEKTELLEVYM
jgi:mannose-6-phosphate isomerase